MLIYTVLRLNADQFAKHSLANVRTVYLNVVSDVVSVNGERLSEGDVETVKDGDVVESNSVLNSEALIFDLP